MAPLAEWEWAAITAADMELPMAWADTVSKHSVLCSFCGSIADVCVGQVIGRGRWALCWEEGEVV